MIQLATELIINVFKESYLDLSETDEERDRDRALYFKSEEDRLLFHLKFFPSISKGVQNQLC